MLKRPGYSVYLSNYDQQKCRLSSLCREGSFLFTSLHISEEFDDGYAHRAKYMCRELAQMGYHIVADVSKKTLAAFGCSDIAAWAKEMGISILRLDYGFTPEEMKEIGKSIPICINASTVTEEELALASDHDIAMYAMHNFYPRPETGLDVELFCRLNERLKESGIKILAFVAGDTKLRGPLGEGLPTLEKHRGMSPYGAWLEMMLKYQVDGVFVGDGIPGETELALIEAYEKDGILRLPISFMGGMEERYQETLCGQPYTIRPDSPRWTKRLKESREYSCAGIHVASENCVERLPGSVTVDNERYMRYSGEIQIVTEPLPADSRVNVAAVVPERYRMLLSLLKNGKKVLLQSDFMLQ